MRSALTTAAGVAGGMLLADSVRNMLGGGHAHASPSHGSSSEDLRAQDARDDAAQDAEIDADNDAGSDADDDRDFDSGGDIEI